MITATLRELKKARDALAAADFNGMAEDFEKYNARILLGEIKAYITAFDPDWLQPPADVNRLPFPFEDARR